MCLLLTNFWKKKGLYDEYNIKSWPIGGDIMSKDEIDLSVFAESHHVIGLVDGDPKSAKARKRFQEKCAALGIECTRLNRYSIENYFSLEALRTVYSVKIPDEVAAILFDEKIEEQVGFNVKKSNRDIARAMKLDDLQGPDLGAFFDRVEEICRSA